MALATLSIDLVAKLASLESGMDKAGRIAEAQAARMQKAFGGLQSVAANIGAGFIAGLAGSQVLASFRATIDGLDALNDAADATGSSIEKLSGLEEIALSTGATLDVVTSSVVKLNQVLNSATPDSSQAAALKAIGLSASELRRLDPSDALLKVAQALAGYADDGDKARLIQELLGKSARELAPFLKDLADRGQIVATVTTEQAAAAERLNKQIATWDANANTLARTLASAVLPELNKMLVLVTELSRGPGLGAAMLEILKGNSVTSAQGGLDLYSKKVAEIDEQIRKLREDKRPLVAANSQGEIAALEARRAKLTGFADAYRNVLNAGSAGAGRGVATGLPERASVGGLPDKVKDKKGKETPPAEVGDLDKYLAKLYEARDAALDLTEVQKAERAIASAGAQGFSEETRRKILAMAEEADSVREITSQRKLEREAMQEIEKSAADSAERLAALRGNSDVGRQAAELDDLLFLYKAYTEGRIKSELEYQQMVDGVLARNKKNTEELTDYAKELGLTFASAFEDAVLEAEKLSDVLKGLLQDILRIVTRKSVTEPLANKLGEILNPSTKGGGGGLGGLFGGAIDWLKGILPFDGGGSTGNGPRSGGLDGKGGFLAMLHPQESVLDHYRGQGVQTYAQPGKVVVHNYAGVQVETRQQRNDEGGIDTVVMLRQLQAAFASDIDSRSGPVYRSMSRQFAMQGAR